MIPRKFTGEMLKGRKATLERDIRNVAGVAIGKGATVTITEVVREKWLTIKTEKCPHCGQYSYIIRVQREDLTLLPNV